jgi:hypothetical protein
MGVTARFARSFNAAIAATGFALVTLVGCGTDTSLTTAPARPTLSEQKLLAIALRVATGAGDPGPKLIQHSEGAREAANRVDSGDIVPGDEWSYLIAERGRFILNGVSVPAGAQAPRGSVLTLIVAARSHEVTDLGVSNRYPHLWRLGPVTTDLRRG